MSGSRQKSPNSVTRVRVRYLSRSMRDWRIVTLATFPTTADALHWVQRAGGSNGRYWIERRQTPATRWA